MNTKEGSSSAVPAGRLNRFARMTRIAAGVAGGMVAEGARQLRAGKRPQIKDMLLTEGNARRIAQELAKLRGAAMKLGQMLSMNADDVIPPELAEILGRLRSDALTMPRAQMNRVLVKAYGKDWRQRFSSFDYQPIAAASIGQVHRAVTPQGDDVVLKIQYPGVRRSINSDVDNVAGLLRMSGLLPRQFDIASLLTEAKAQLHDEANYLLEADYLHAFGTVLRADSRFIIPKLYRELTTDSILAMSLASGDPIESIAQCDQQERDRVLSALLELMLREVFELKMVQTDSNFANYRYQPWTRKIVLLDFGATRRFSPEFVDAFRELLRALLADDSERILRAATAAGYTVEGADPAYGQLMLDIFRLIGEVFRSEQPYAIRGENLSARVTEKSLAMQGFRDDWRAPPIDALLFHRKFAGLLLLASRVDARINLRPVLRTLL